MEFTTKSDTEVVLGAYLYWGEYFISRLNGIFAFAVWDHNEKELFMARDRIGVKPFFFYRYDSGMIFGSELKAILKNPLVKARVGERGLMELFLIGPGRTQGQAVFEGIEELLPGEYAIYNGRKIVRKRYFELHAHEFEDDAKESVIQQPHEDEILQVFEKQNADNAEASNGIKPEAADASEDKNDNEQV